jgi:hypothetical protein
MNNKNNKKESSSSDIDDKLNYIQVKVSHEMNHPPIMMESTLIILLCLWVVI